MNVPGPRVRHICVPVSDQSLDLNHVVPMTAMLRNHDDATRLRDMRQFPRRRLGIPSHRSQSTQAAPDAPRLYDMDAESDDGNLEGDFWGRTMAWTRREHHHQNEFVDPDAETAPMGLDRVDVAEGFDDLDAVDAVEPVAASAQWAERLGVASIDPLIARTGVILLAAVLAVPFAWAMRDDASAAALPGQAPVAADPAAATESPVPETDPLLDPVMLPAPASDEAATTTPVIPMTTNPSTTVSTPEASTRSSGTRTQVTSVTTTLPAPVCGSNYVVRPGDSWSLVADRASIKMSELLNVNGATSRSMLYPDDEICLPPGAVVVIPTTVPRTTAPRVTSAPTTTTTVVLPPEPSQSDAEAIIRDVWPDDLEDHALDIARRESRLHANVSNWCCVGLFQIHWNAHKRWLSGIGVTEKVQLFDARTNAMAAYALYQRNGWSPWDL